MVTTRSGATTNKSLVGTDHEKVRELKAKKKIDSKLKIKALKKGNRKQKASSIIDEEQVQSTNDSLTADNIRDKIRDEFQKKPKTQQTLAELQSIGQKIAFQVPEDGSMQEMIVKICEELARDLGTSHLTNKLLLQQQPPPPSPYSNNNMDVTSSVSEYDMTVIPEQVDLEEKDYRKDKKIPTWAKDGPELHLNLYMQQPYFIDLMSCRCFPSKRDLKLRML